MIEEEVECITNSTVFSLSMGPFSRMSIMRASKWKLFVYFSLFQFGAETGTVSFPLPSTSQKSRGSIQSKGTYPSLIGTNVK